MSYDAQEASVAAGSPYFLYLFDSGGRVEIGNAAIYFALDVSGSMDGQRLENMAAAVQSTLANIQANSTGPIDVRMVAWSASVAGSIERRAIDAQGFADVAGWLATLTASGGTNFSAAVSQAGAFFAGSGTKRRVLIFITDGLPEPASTASTAAATLAGIPDVEVYCFNIDEGDTTYTKMLDNTHGDGVPVITSGYAGPLTAALAVAFGISDGQVRLTSEAKPVTAMGETWEPSEISHGNIEVTGSVERNDLRFIFGLSNPFARTFLQPASVVTTITIWRGHRTDLSGQFEVTWKGRVVGASIKKEQIEVTAESVFTSLRRAGCSQRQQRPCRHALYHLGCNLNRNDFKVPTTVTAINGLKLTAPEAATAPANDFKAGIIEWNGLLAHIRRHKGNEITISAQIPGMAQELALKGSVNVLLFPGCDQTRKRCNKRFNNGLNHGGFSWMSSKNPFGSSII